MGRVFSLGDRTVESIMTRPSELAWIDAAASQRRSTRRWPERPTTATRRQGSSTNCWAWSASKTFFLHLGDEGFDLRRLVAPAKFFH